MIRYNIRTSRPSDDPTQEVDAVALLELAYRKLPYKVKDSHNRDIEVNKDDVIMCPPDGPFRDQFYSFLSIPNGSSVAYMLMDHSNALGKLTIISISVFQDPGTNQFHASVNLGPIHK